MKPSPDQVMEELRQGKFHPLYFLQGEEPYFVDLIADYIETHALDEAQKGFNQVIMYGKDSTVDAILTNARRFPMMANRQVVIVKEAQEIGDFGRKDAQKLLEAYVENPLVSTVLVFCYKYKTLDGRRALTKTISDKAILVNTKKLFDNKVPGWVLDYVKSRNAAIDYETAQLLSDYIGNDLQRLSNEIDKVLLNLPAGLPDPAKIDRDAVQKYVGISKDYNIFELQKAIGVRDNVKAQRIVRYFAANPKLNPVIQVIAVLFSFFSKLLVAHSSKSDPEQTLVKEFNFSRYILQDYQAAVRNYNREQIVRNIGHLRTADMMVKGVGNQQTPPGEILRELIFKLMH